MKTNQEREEKELLESAKVKEVYYYARKLIAKKGWKSGYLVHFNQSDLDRFEAFRGLRFLMLTDCPLKQTQFGNFLGVAEIDLGDISSIVFRTKKEARKALGALNKSLFHNYKIRYENVTFDELQPLSKIAYETKRAIKPYD